MAPGKGFHLGEEIDLATLRPAGRPLLYDPDRLTTHGVCFGMTGSGKTGVCVVLLEEAIRAGIPCLVLDLKGDLANLALSFPSLEPGDFEPWVDGDEAARQGMTPQALAASIAGRWRDGLAAAGIRTPEIAAMRAAGVIAVFTPGSTAGRPVNVLGGFAPGAPTEEDPEIARGRFTNAVAALLDLAGVQADPITSPEGIFLAGSFERTWSRGETVTLERLIRDLADPPVTRLGVMDLDDLFPKPKRMAAAAALNALVAAPAFAAWTKGAPLDPAVLLRAADGRPRASIFYLAHLSERERSFFTASLLSSVVSWMRAQGGATTLRALLYMDEIYGYLPPHPANPPSKEPLLTLLKQARASGLGVLLATQNPVDVDYKALANAGTWLLGRLQTDQDRERLMDGMLGAAGAGADRAALERAISALPPRSFVLHDSRSGGPRLFTSRWAISYLRGPMTREEIRRLPEAKEAAPEARAGAPEVRAAPAGGIVARPKIAEGVPERFIAAGAAPLRPFLLATARVTFEDAKAGIHEVRERSLVVPAEAAGASPDWARARDLTEEVGAPATMPPEGATYEPVPAAWQRAATFRQAGASLKGWLAVNESLPIFRNGALKIASRPGESRPDFAVRCRREAESRAQEDLRACQVKMQDKVRRLQAKVEKESADVSRDQQEAQMRKAQEAIGIGQAVLGTLFGGRRSAGSSILGAGQRRRMSRRADMQVEKSRLEAEAARQELAALQAEAGAAAAEIERKWAETALAFEETVMRPRKTAIEVIEIAVLWVNR